MTIENKKEYKSLGDMVSSMLDDALEEEQVPTESWMKENLWQKGKNGGKVKHFQGRILYLKKNQMPGKLENWPDYIKKLKDKKYTHVCIPLSWAGSTAHELIKLKSKLTKARKLLSGPIVTRRSL
jgi:hypothetical protein